MGNRTALMIIPEFNRWSMPLVWYPNWTMLNLPAIKSLIAHKIPKNIINMSDMWGHMAPHGITWHHVTDI